MIRCYCGARFDPKQESVAGDRVRRSRAQRIAFVEFAYRLWYRQHGGPLRRCGVDAPL